MSAPGPLARTPTTPWSVWKYNWIINHRVIRAVRAAARHARGTLLDVGCGTKAFEPWIAPRVSRYLGIDLPDSHYIAGGGPDVYGRGEQIPFRDGSFDTVLGLSIVTCFPEPQRLLAEAHRVLKPDGMLLLEFTQMAPLHDAPHDYFRFTRHGAALLLERAGFEPIEFIPIGGLASHVGHALIFRLNRLNRGPLRILTELPVRALYVAVQITFDLLDRLFHDPDDVISHLVVARRRPSAGARAVS